MLKKKIYFILLLSLPMFAQKEGANWFFGTYAAVTFNSGSPVALPGGALSTNEGCASMSTPGGNLLFYTDGITVYNSVHAPMPNGMDLNGHPSSTQSAIVIPAPMDFGRYYVFTVDYQGNNNGLQYSKIDMSLNGGLGDVIINEKNVALHTPVAEKISAVYHSNMEDIWVITHGLNNSEYLAYLVTANGVSTTPVISTVGNVHTCSNFPGGEGAIGYLKFSPDGKKLACAIILENPGLELLDFDSATGIVSNAMEIYDENAYGVEFSPAGNLLYFTKAQGDMPTTVMQCDITLPTQASIQSSLTTISFQNSGALQLGIDGKIYISRVNQTALDVIHNPNNQGAACNFESAGVSLAGKFTNLGLPNFFQSFFLQAIITEDVCEGESNSFSIKSPIEPTSAFWVFGDGETSDEFDVEHTYTEPGTYTVTVDFTTAVHDEVITLTKEVKVFPAVEANATEEILVCEIPFDGVATFNLGDKNVSIIGNQNPADLTVTYYSSQELAEEGEEFLPVSYNNIENPQTIYARVTNTETGCYDITSFNLIVNPIPDIANPQDLMVCEEEQGEGIAVFNLTNAIPQITQNNNDLQVTFYLTASNLSNNIPINIPTSYNNTVAYGETIFFKVINPATPQCSSIGELGLVINPLPTLNDDIADYIVCDYNNAGDGFEVFDLTSMYSSITSTPGLTLTYEYQNAGTRTVITDPTNFTNTVAGQQTIYVSTINASGCRREVSFVIEVNPLPALNLNTDPFYACEEVQGEGRFDLGKITQWLTTESANYTVKYYLSEPQAELGDTDNLSSPHISAPTTIYARLENAATGCGIIAPVQLDVLPAPIAATPAPLEECDANNDGFARFNLDPVIQDIKNALGNVDVTIHETIEDATHNVHVVAPTATYDNIEQYAQTLYVRVQSSQTECYDLVELRLIVHPVPEAVTPTPYGLCDNGSSDTDGRATFDLTTKTAEILGTIDPLLFTVTFHETNNDAIAGTPAIANPMSFTTANTTVYVRVTNNATGCYDIVPLQLIVHPLPIAVQPTVAITLCDVTAPANDQKEVFDLTTAIPGIIGTQQGLIVTFHHTYAQAEGNTGAILTPESYRNTQLSVETLFVRVTTEATGCYRIVLLDIKVEPLPVILEPTQEELTVCDTNGQGIGVFDLEALIEKMRNGEPNLEITFHLSIEDALNGLHAIPNTDNYQNTQPFQVIYVRVRNTETGCVNSTPYALTLIVEPAPQAPNLEDLTICDQDNNGQDGRARFDLTVQNQVIYDALGLTDTDLTIHYFETEAQANAGVPRITTAATYMGTNGQRIWTRVESVTNNCYSLTSFVLRINAPLLLTIPEVFAKCNEALPNDGKTVFDLTTRNNEILGPLGVGKGYTVAYYETDPRQNPTAQPIADPSAYTNTVNPKTLFVVVTSKEGCTSYTTLTIKVLPLPVPDTTQDTLVLCDDNNSPDGVEEFDLTLAEADIRDNDTQSVISYYRTIEEAEAGTNPIPDPTAYESATGSVWVRVEANTNNPDDPKCYQVVELPLQVNPLPAIGDANGNVPPYAICQQNSTGFAEFDLNSHIEEILGANSATDYEIEFYLDQAALDAGTALPRMYTNVTPNSQTILVVVTNIATGCTITKPLQLFAEEAAIANPVAQPVLSVCDYEDDNDGVVTWDLTEVEAEVLGTQNPADYEVTYYTSEADAQNYENAIATPQAYENTPDNQTIWIRVTNTSTVSKCHDITTIELNVERLAEPVISTEGNNNTICVEFGTDIVERALELRSGITPNGHIFHWFRDGQALADADPNSGVYLAQEAGSYTVQVTGPQPNACESEESAVFEVIRSGKAKAKGKGYFVTNAFSDNQTITVLVEGYGEYEYSLDNGPRQTLNVFTNVSPGPHDVHVWDVKTGAFSCDELVISGVSIIDYPNFFTPNGDGFHDTWNIIGLAEQTDAKIYIFDRYGKLIKQIAANGEGWDGTFNGNPVPSTDYWFTVTYKEYVGDKETTKEFKAHFSLKR